MKELVTNRQIFVLILFSMVGNSVMSLPGKAIEAAGTGAWVTLMLLTGAFIISSIFIAGLCKKFQGKTIFEYSRLLVGKPAAFIICFIYASYFLFLVILICRNSAEFVKGSYLPLTPVWVLILLMIVISVYTAHKGIRNIGRLCEIYAYILIFVSLSIHTHMFFIGDIKYIQPFFELKQIKQYVFAAKDLIVQFLGIEILTFIPFGKNNKKKGILYCVLVILYVGSFYAFNTGTSTMITGINDIVKYDNSLIEALRETELPESFLLGRGDLIFAVAGFFNMVVGVSILFYVCTESFSKLFSGINKKILLVIIGIITYASSNFALSAELSDFLFNNAVPVYAVFTIFLIPIILSIIAGVKKIEN